MSDIKTVDVDKLIQDNEEGCCNYDQTTNIISPIAGKILVFRTHDNKYAKIEILNFYDAAMSNPYGGFYTFNYVYQPNDNTLNF